MGMVFIAVLLLQCVLIIVKGENSSRLVQLSDCTCLGHNQTFKCVVFGAGITIWQGTAFQSPCVIRLRHSQYNSHDQAIGECNNGAIIARSIGVSGDHFTSQLSVMVRQDMINETVECLHQSIDGVSSIIGIKQLEITTEAYQPPSSVHLEAVDRNHLMFAWNPVPQHCPTIRYITITNCSVCPNSTSDMFIACELSNVSINTSHMCMFTVSTEVCGHILGDMSEDVTVHLSVPSPPKFILKFHHNHVSQRVIVEIVFNISYLAISDNIDGSPISYTITYTDFISSRLCDSFTVPASTICQLQNGLCHHMFTISPPCSPSNATSIAIFATNVLGDGPHSNPVIFSCISYGFNNRIQVNTCTTENLIEDQHTTFTAPDDLCLPLAIVTGVLSAILAITIVALTLLAVMFQKYKASMKKNSNLVPATQLTAKKCRREVKTEYYEEIDELHTSTKMNIEMLTENVAYSTITIN